MASVVLEARAKINLTLEVLTRRADGYHELRSVFALTDLCDEVRVATARTLDVRISPPLDLPRGGDLSSRAVRALAAIAGREAAAYVRVRKRIPVAAGLGGGSSDAAATLRGLASLWRLDADLELIGASVGSDVPFFASAAPFALVEGRGERVDPLPQPRLPLWIALVTLPSRLRTAEVFAAWDQERSADGTSRRLAAALREGIADVALVRELARNDLQAAAERCCPAIAEAREAAERLGITLVLSGSGPSLYAVAEDEGDAIRLARRLRRCGLRARPRRLGVASF